MKMIWRDKPGAVIAMIAVFIVVSSAPFLQSGARGLLINKLVVIAGSHEIARDLWWLVGILIAATLVPSILYAIQGYISQLFWFFIEEKFEMLFLKRTAAMDVATHEDPKSSDLFNKVRENGTWRLRNFIDRQFYLLQNVAEVAIAMVILITGNWWLFGIILLGTIPELIIEVLYGRETWGIHSSRAEIRRRYWDLTHHFQSLPTLIELKLFQNTKYFITTIRELFLTFQNEVRSNERKKLWRQLLALTVSQAATGFALGWFVYEVVNGNLQIGTLTFYLASIGEMRQSLSSLFRNLGQQYSDSLFASDFFTLLDLKPVIVKPVAGYKIPADHTPEIVFEHVDFAYPKTNKLVLKDFSLRIAPGEKIALVGINGAGKTTFVKLLCRFYDPTKGRILIDGHDLREVDLDSWYRHIGAIFQDYSQYHFVVKESIAIGRSQEKLSMEKVKTAAVASQANTFIEEWDKKYDQMLGKNFTDGIEPSTGQWQKLALARTFYRDARVVVLDEPTSAIDAEAEAKIFEQLEALSKQHTVLLISHRFSTVRHADRIAVIENGRLAELGSHEELLANNKSYARLFRLQAAGYQ